jgi:hypothetical protein
MVTRSVARRALVRTTIVGVLVTLTASGGLLAADPSAAPAGRAAPAASPSMSQLANVGLMVSAMTPQPADRSFAKSVVAAGFDEATAAFMALTLSTVEVMNARALVVRHAFPNGATGEVTYTLQPGVDLEPGGAPEFSADAGPDDYRFTMRWAVDVASLPADLGDQVLGGLPDAVQSIARADDASVRLLGLASTEPLRGVYAADRPGTLEIVANGVISQGKSKAIDKFVKTVEDRGWTKTAKSYKALKAGKKVWQAVEANDLISQALARLRALRRCAEEPTDPLAQKAYAEDPAEKQRVVSAVDEAEREVRESGMLMFGALLTTTGSSLIKTAPWLGFIVGPANDYIKETNVGLIEEQVRVAEQRVVPCQSSYTISGTIPSVPSGITVTGTACSLEKPFELEVTGDLVGRLKVRPNRETGGTWAFQGKVGNAPLKALGSGAYSVSLDDDRSSGTLDLDMQITIRIPRVGDQSGGGLASLTLTAAPLCAE